MKTELVYGKRAHLPFYLPTPVTSFKNPSSELFLDSNNYCKCNWQDFFFLRAGSSRCLNHEACLKQKLWPVHPRHDGTIRPLLNSSEVLVVRLNFSIMSLLKIVSEFCVSGSSHRPTISSKYVRDV